MARLLSLQKHSADRHGTDGMCAGMLIAADNFCSAEWNRFRYQISRNSEVEERKSGAHTIEWLLSSVVGLEVFPALEGSCSSELTAQSQMSCLLLLPPLSLSSCPLESSQKGWRVWDDSYIMPFGILAVLSQSHFQTESVAHWLSNFGEVLVLKCSNKGQRK